MAASVDEVIGVEEGADAVAQEEAEVVEVESNISRTSDHKSKPKPTPAISPARQGSATPDIALLRVSKALQERLWLCDAKRTGWISQASNKTKQQPNSSKADLRAYTQSPGSPSNSKPSQSCPILIVTLRS